MKLSPLSIMKYFSLFIFSLFASGLFAQDTIVLLSGEIIPVKSFTINEKENIISFVNKRGKDKFIELDFIFSVRQSNGEELVVYKDSVFEDDSITVNEMREFVTGSITASETYHAPLATISGFIVGAGAVYLFPMAGIPIFWSPVVPAGYSAIIGSLTPKEKCILRNCPEASGRPYFQNGYSQVCQQKRVTNVVKGSLAGMAAMIIVAIIVSQ